MKVIACLQCGALIKDISNWSFSVRCDYCGANYLIPQFSKSTFDVNRDEFEQKSKRSRLKFEKLNQHMSRKGNAITWRSPFASAGDSKQIMAKIPPNLRSSSGLDTDRAAAVVLVLVLVFIMILGYLFSDMQ
ncbi:MAG: hypothetical protein HKN25_05420 [Pyrinomonadaceae bacterium]|nr:hypothetical protein [Pyrinomonadaceae bacterium]